MTDLIPSAEHVNLDKPISRTLESLIKEDAAIKESIATDKKQKSKNTIAYSHRLKTNLSKTVYYTPGNKEELKRANGSLKDFLKEVETDNKKFDEERDKLLMNKERDNILEKIKLSLPENKDINHLSLNMEKLNINKLKEKVAEEKNINIENPENKKEIDEAVLEAARNKINKHLTKKTAVDASETTITKISRIDIYNRFHNRMIEERGANMCVFGSSGSGKTTFLIDMINSLQMKLPDMITTLFTPSLSAPIYSKLNDNIIVAGDMSDVIINCQRNINKKLGAADSVGSGIKYRFLNITDDIVDQNNSMDQVKAFLTDRNLKISSIVSIQDAKLINKKARGNINFVLLGRFNNREAQRSIIESFLLGFSLFTRDWEKNYALYDKLTSGHKWLFIDQLEGKIYTIN
jgi:hypothetical protein